MMRRSSWAMAKIAWYFGTKSSGWVAMDPNSSAKLDDAVQQGLRTTSFRIGGQSYSFDLSANVQTNESSKTQRPISSQGPSGQAPPTLPSPAPSQPSSGVTTPVTRPQAPSTALQNRDRLVALKQSLKERLDRLSSTTVAANSAKPITRRRFATLTKRAFSQHVDLLSEAYRAELRLRAAKEDALKKEVKELRLALRSAKRNRRRQDKLDAKSAP